MADTKSEGRARRSVLFDPASKEPFQLSRYRLERFLSCPRCFWLHQRKGIKRPEPPHYTLNSAVDALVKNEFDIYRKRQEPHPLMLDAGIDAVPYAHPQLEDWRHTFKGMRVLHEATNLVISGAPDDIWLLRGQSPKLVVVDAKSTSTSKEMEPVDTAERWQSFRRQAAIYIWLLMQVQKEVEVSRTAYLLHLNGDKRSDTFDWTLHFAATLVPYRADIDWIDGAIIAAHACLMSDVVPKPGAGCDFCAFVQGVNTATRPRRRRRTKK